MKKLLFILSIFITSISYGQIPDTVFLKIKGGGGTIDSLNVSKLNGGKIDTAHIPISIVNITQQGIGYPMIRASGDTIYSKNIEAGTNVTLDSTDGGVKINVAAGASGISQLGTGYLLTKINDSTYNVDSAGVSALYPRRKDSTVAFTTPYQNSLNGTLAGTQTWTGVNAFKIPAYGTQAYKFLTGTGVVAGAFINGNTDAAPLFQIIFPYSAYIGGYNGILRIIPSTGNGVGIGMVSPTSLVHLGAGTTTLAPFGFTSGSLLTTPLDGKMEYGSGHLYFTIGSTRWQIDQQAGGGYTLPNATKASLGGVIVGQGLGVSSGTVSVNPILIHNQGGGVSTLRYSDSSLYSRNISVSSGLSLSISDSSVKINLGDSTITGANLQSYLNSHSSVQLPADTLKITSNIIIPTGIKITGVRGKTVILLTGSATVGFVIKDVRNISISNIDFVGDTAWNGGPKYNINSSSILSDTTSIMSLDSIGTHIGISVTGNSSYIVLNALTFKWFNKAGLYCDSTTTISFYEGAISATNLMAENCYSGYYFGNGGEYNKLANITSSSCLIGFISTAGNTYITNGFFNYCRVGFIATPGTNDTHSSLANCSFNHNILYSIFAYDITKGLYLSNCQNFSSTIYLLRTMAFSWNGGRVEGNIIVNNGGINMFSNAIFNLKNITAVGTINLIFSNNYTNAGVPVTYP